MDLDLWTDEALQVRRACGRDGDIIDSYWVDRITNQIRWVERDGKLVLQSWHKVKVHFSKDIWKNDIGQTQEDIKYIWLDVPIEKE